MRELHVFGEDKSKEPSWDRKVGIWHEMVYEGASLPPDFKHLLEDEYRHLVTEENSKRDEAKLSWESFKTWVGDFTEDARTSRERLESYFTEQERKAGLAPDHG